MQVLCKILAIFLNFFDFFYDILLTNDEINGTIKAYFSIAEKYL